MKDILPLSMYITMDEIEALGKRFTAKLLETVDIAKSELKYNPSFFHKMVSEHGGIYTAKKLINAEKLSDGFAKLWELKRLDLTVEAIVLDPQWKTLFSEDELKKAEDRLRECNFVPKKPLADDPLKDLFIEIATNYKKSETEEFTDHPLANLIRQKPTEIIETLINDKELFIKSSAGQSQWAQIPWIAIINRSESDGAQEGIYIVYLFSEDMQRLYLCLGQGISKPIETEGREIAFKKMQAKAIDIRTNYPLAGFIGDNELELANTGTGSDYEKVVILYKEYQTRNFPNNLELENDLRKLVAYYKNYLLEDNVLTEGTDFSPGAVEEGKKILKAHYIRERNPRIIREAKRIALERSSELRCEICNFSFFEHYGDRGENFIEGHHKKPVSEMKPGEMTEVSDIILLCSNCHRIIHAKQPWLSIEELRNIHH